MPNTLGIVLIAILGLLFGSFLNVCITRLPAQESVSHPRSHCRSCGAALRWRHNVPVLSFVALRGKCAFCGERFSWRYPAVELSLSLLWLACAARWNLTPPGLLGMVFCFLALGLLFTDLETMLLPDAFTISGTVLGVLLNYLASPMPATALRAIAGAAVGFAMPFLVRVVYRLIRKREGMGLGDAKLMAMVGAFLGWQGALLTFGLGAVVAALAGAALLARSRENLRAMLPLGTYLCLTAIFSLFAGNAVWRWYIGFFH